MAYYLAVETENEIFEALKIKKPKYFNANESDSSTYECTLEEIEEYTTKYPNFHELTHQLASYGILKYRDLNKQLAIFYVKGIEVRKLEGGILYKESKPLYENPQLIIDYIKNKVQENDIMFFRKLQSTLPEKSLITYMVAKLATTMERNEINNINHAKKQTPIDGNLVLTLAQSLIYDCYIDGSGELIITDTLDKEELHKMISFITDYEKELKIKQTNHVRKREKPQ